MDLDPIITFIFGSILGGLVKFIYDFFGQEIAWRKELQTNTRKKIETQAPNYHLMSTYAEMFSGSLNKYLRIKSNLQMISIQPTGQDKPKNSDKTPDKLSDEDLKYSPMFNPIYSSHLDKAAYIAKISLFNAGKLLDIQSKHFLKEGKDYFFPDWWAIKSIEDLHHALNNIFPFDQAILLKHVEEEDEPHDFFKKLKDDSKKDLKELYENYYYWLLFEDLGVRELSHFAEAYDNIFDQQIDKFYRIWFEKRDKWYQLFPKKHVKTYDPANDQGTYLELKPETRRLMKIFRKNKDNTREKWRDSKLSELEDDAILIEMNSLFNTGWKHYCREEYKLALDSQMCALKLLERWHEESKHYHYSMENIYKKKKSKIYNALGNIYTNRGIVKADEASIDRAKEHLKRAELAYTIALNHDDKHHVIHLNFGILYKRMAKMYLKKQSSQIKTMEGFNTIYKAMECCDKAVEKYKTSIDRYHRESEKYRDLSGKYQEMAYIYYYAGRTYFLKVDLFKKLYDADEIVLKKAYCDIFKKTYQENPENKCRIYFKENIENNFKKGIKNYRQAISLKPTEYIFYKDLERIYDKYGELEPKSKTLAIHYCCKSIIKIKESRNILASKKTLNFYSNTLSNYCNELEDKLNNKDISKCTGAYYRECGKANNICKNREKKQHYDPAIFENDIYVF